MGKRVEEFELPATPEAPALARDLVGRVVAGEGWVTSGQIDDLRLVVSEAVTNSVRAHDAAHPAPAQNATAPSGPVVIRCEVDDMKVVVSITDRAGGFSAPDELPTVPEPDLSRESGLGLPLMGTIADEARVDSSSSGTLVRLVVRREA